MDERLENTEAEEALPKEETPEEKPAYTPRPAAQVWLARIALVVFVAIILLYYYNMMRGGQ